jgi:hypothetical protein
MIVELNPGTRSGGPPVRDGYTVPIANTLPDVNLDEILAVLDGDTRTYLQMLLNGAATGLENNGGNLAQVFRRFEPTARDTATFTKLLAQRRQYIRRSIHNFGVFTNALAARDQQLATFVDSSNEVFQHFANQDANLQRCCRPRCATRTERLGRRRRSPIKPGRRSTRFGRALVRSVPRSSLRARSCSRRPRSSRTSCGRLRESRRRS